MAVDGIAEKRLSRRQFVGSAAAGAAALGAVAGATALIPKVSGVPTSADALPAGKAGAAVGGQPIPVPTDWAQMADVVVVGYGSAGAVAAITAFDAGADVLIVEKT
ncbi:MAG: FAD-binding protein, partial [Nitrososphaerales archaeon]